MGVSTSKQEWRNKKEINVMTEFDENNFRPKEIASDLSETNYSCECLCELRDKLIRHHENTHDEMKLYREDLLTTAKLTLAFQDAWIKACVEYKPALDDAMAKLNKLFKCFDVNILNELQKKNNLREQIHWYWKLYEQTQNLHSKLYNLKPEDFDVQLGQYEKFDENPEPSFPDHGISFRKLKDLHQNPDASLCELAKQISYKDRCEIHKALDEIVYAARGNAHKRAEKCSRATAREIEVLDAQYVYWLEEWWNIRINGQELRPVPDPIRVAKEKLVHEYRKICSTSSKSKDDILTYMIPFTILNGYHEEVDGNLRLLQQEVARASDNVICKESRLLDLEFQQLRNEWKSQHECDPIRFPCPILAKKCELTEKYYKMLPSNEDSGAQSSPGPISCQEKEEELVPDDIIINVHADEEQTFADDNNKIHDAATTHQSEMPPTSQTDNVKNNILKLDPSEPIHETLARADQVRKDLIDAITRSKGTVTNLRRRLVSSVLVNA